MKVDEINAKLGALDWKEVAQQLRSGVCVCVGEATEQEWNAFVESDPQTLRSTNMEWLQEDGQSESDHGKIYVVELPWREHGLFCMRLSEAFYDATSSVHGYLEAHGGMVVHNGRLLEPDLSYGPTQSMEKFGAHLPVGVKHWKEYHTLKIEVGVAQSWPQLDWKAQQWAAFPGVAYVLCVHLDWKLHGNGSFKLYELKETSEGTKARLPNISETPIAGHPESVPLALDSRRLLGVSHNSELPKGFPEPMLAIDLFAVLEQARALQTQH